MDRKRDCYEVLGIDRNADEGTIKKAYRKLAKKYHPDTNAGNVDAEQKFKEITEAYTILSDPEKRKLYDRYGHAAFDGSAPQGGKAYENAGNGYYTYHYESGDMDDIFGDIFGDIFHGTSSGQFGGRGFQRSGFPRRGADLELEIFITFEEAAFGCDKTIRLQDQNGIPKSLQVHIPAGIETGKSVRLRGKGAPGMNGAEAGDLLLRVTVGEKSGFERKGMDVYSTVWIPFTTAVFGGEARVKTLYGDVLCKVKEGTQSGTKIRLRGKGIVSMKQPGVYGDHYVTVQIEVPRNLSTDERMKLKEYEQATLRNHRGNVA